MLTEQKRTIVEILVALAWADGHVDAEERVVVAALAEAFDSTEEETADILDWAATPRKMDDVDISKLTKSDLELALQYGVLLTFVDGEQTEDEVRSLKLLTERFGLSAREAQPLLESATLHAQRLLPELAQ